MQRFKPLADPLPIEVEIRAEKAQALGRTARALEREIERLRALESRLLTLPLCERSALAGEQRALVKSAARRLWYLVVHREALGLRRHEELYEAYRIPRTLVPNP